MKAIFAEFDGRVAAVIVEAVAANMGVYSTESRISEELRRLLHRHGALLTLRGNHGIPSGVRRST